MSDWREMETFLGGFDEYMLRQKHGAGCHCSRCMAEFYERAASRIEARSDETLQAAQPDKGKSNG